MATATLTRTEMPSAVEEFMGAFTRMARSFDAESESKQPISKVQMGAHLKALRVTRHLTSEASAVRFNEMFAPDVTLSGSSLRSYERGDTEIPARVLLLLVAMYKARGGLEYMADAFRNDIAKALGIKKDD